VSSPYAALALPSFCLVGADGRVVAAGPVNDAAVPAPSDAVSPPGDHTGEFLVLD